MDIPSVPNIMGMIPGFWSIIIIVLLFVAIAIGGPILIAWFLEQMGK